MCSFFFFFCGCCCSLKGWEIEKKTGMFGKWKHWLECLHFLSVNLSRGQLYSFSILNIYSSISHLVWGLMLDLMDMVGVGNHSTHGWNWGYQQCKLKFLGRGQELSAGSSEKANNRNHWQKTELGVQNERGTKLQPENVSGKEEAGKSEARGTCSAGCSAPCVLQVTWRLSCPGQFWLGLLSTQKCPNLEE